MTGPSAGRTAKRTARRRTAGRTAGRRTALPHGADDEPSGRQRSLQRRSDGIPVAPQLTRLRHQFRLFRLGYHAFRPQFRSGIHRSSSLPSLPPLSPSPPYSSFQSVCLPPRSTRWDRFTWDRFRAGADGFHSG